MVKPRKVNSILSNLANYRAKLALLAAIPENAFLKDFTKVASAKYLLQISIETCLDIAHHIVADDGLRHPRDSYDAFVVLNEEGIIPDDFLPALRQMVSFRNRVVHLYWEIDDQIVFQIVQDNLGDLDRFASLIAVYLADAVDERDQ
ncbi:MAG: DUF86 domain-containing protein [Chloroflexi bacterium]|nr:DUF86 domain-containing protein [Chloroflexota bacterium]